MNRHTKVILAKTERFSIKILKKGLAICIGSFLIALSYSILITPNHLLSGGVGGIALAINYITGFPIFLSILLLNIPIFIWGFKELDKEFMIYSLLGALTFIFALPVIEPFLNTLIPIPQLDLILVSIFSGIVSGLGIGITIKFGSSTGGNDIFSVIIKKKLNISVGAFSFIFNLLVLLTSLVFFPLEIILYTFISMWVSGRITDFVLEGFNVKKSVMIISEKNELISEKILNELHRGVTYLRAEGGFTGNSKLMLNTIVNNYENAKLREIVNEIDSKAFMYITDAIEVSGKGFTRSR